MQPLVTSGFHHITLVSGNVRRTLAFYRDLLGIGLVKRTVNFDEPQSYHLYFGDEVGRPGTILTFFEWAGARRGAWGAGGVHHLALGVATPEAQLKWKRRLEDARVPVAGPFDRVWFQSIYFRDPDGQILEIATAGPGYAVDEPADDLGGRIVVPDSSHLRGHRDEGAIQMLTHSEPVPEITPDMVLTGIHHITGITDQIGAVAEFYEAALGLRLVKRSVNQDDPSIPHLFWASYDGREVKPRSSLTFFGWPRGTRPARPGVGQTHHIAFRAPDADTQLAWREHLRAMDVNVSEVMDREYFTSIYFRAPDGLLCEIATDGPGFLVDEPADALGTGLRLPPWLEPEREALEAQLQPLG